MPTMQMPHASASLIVLLSFFRAHASSPITGAEGLFQTEASEPTKIQLQPDMHLPGAPTWLVGDLMIAGGHEFEMGNARFNHAFDAFGRVLNLRLQPGDQRIECIYSARMMQSQFYLKSKAAGKIVPSMRFEDTVPSSNASVFSKLAGPVDNAWVQQIYFGGTYWSTTDASPTLTYDENLENWQRVKWQDWLGLQLQVAHAIVSPWTGKMVGMGSTFGVFKGKFVLYEIDPAEPYKRVELASVSVPSHLPPYEHSFGLGGDFAVICGHPFGINPLKLASSGLFEAMEVDTNGNTTFYFVNLTTQAVEQFVAPPYVIYHFVNPREVANGDVVFENPTFTCNVYALFHMPTALSNEALNHFRDNCEGVLRQFTLHRSGPLSGTVSTRVLDGGWMEFPQFNQLWRGRASCFIYQVEWYHGGSNEYASMALVKFDVCKEKRAAVWAVRGHFPGEPKFIPRPNATAEDDGVIASLVLDGGAQSSYWLILDASTMQPLEQFDVGARVPSTLHGVWKFASEASLVASTATVFTI